MSVMSELLDKYIGFWSIVKTYGWNNFFKDSLVPTILALVVIIVAIAYCNDSYALFDKVVALCISVLPSYLGLLVAAYTILLALLTTEAIAKLKKIDDNVSGCNGKDLIRTLNSDFAICILIAGFALFLSSFFSIISSLNIVFVYADVVNYSCIFLMAYLLTYALTVLVGLIEDLYNIGQTTTIL